MHTTHTLFVLTIVYRCVRHDTSLSLPLCAQLCRDNPQRIKFFILLQLRIVDSFIVDRDTRTIDMIVDTKTADYADWEYACALLNEKYTCSIETRKDAKGVDVKKLCIYFM